MGFTVGLIFGFLVSAFFMSKARKWEWEMLTFAAELADEYNKLFLATYGIPNRDASDWLRELSELTD